MEHVIHKFILTESATDVALERDARVLYADRDSRTNNPAIWVLRPVDEARTVYRRRFHVVMTGERFKASTTWRPIGLVRLGEIIAHVLEEDAPGWGSTADVSVPARDSTSAPVDVASVVAEVDAALGLPPRAFPNK